MSKQEKTFDTIIICTKCLFTKKNNLIESDPLNTKIITTDSCEKCCAESNGGIKYFDESMNLLNQLPHLQKQQESDAVLFAEWINRNYYPHESFKDVWIRFTSVGFTCNSKELYKIFKSKQ